jgi:hypothetical protein
VDWAERKKTWLPEDSPPAVDEPHPYFVRGPEDDEIGYAIIFLLPCSCRLTGARRAHEAKFWLIGLARCYDPAAEYFFVHHHNHDRAEPVMIGGRLVFPEIDSAARMMTAIKDTWLPAG